LYPAKASHLQLAVSEQARLQPAWVYTWQKSLVAQLAIGACGHKYLYPGELLVYICWD